MILIKYNNNNNNMRHDQLTRGVQTLTVTPIN